MRRASRSMCDQSKPRTSPVRSPASAPIAKATLNGLGEAKEDAPDIFEPFEEWRVLRIAGVAVQTPGRAWDGPDRIGCDEPALGEIGEESREEAHAMARRRRAETTCERVLHNA